MLPKYYRFHVMNNTGQTATKDDGAALSIRLSPWEFDVDGSLSYGTTITDNLGFDAAMTILDGASTEGDVQDNTVNKYLGLNGYFEAIHDLATASGQWDLYIESSDDNVNWPSDSNDFDIEKDLDLVISLMVASSGLDKSRACNFVYE